MKLSVVTSVYSTARFMPEFVARVDAAARDSGLADHEIIAVIDGSPDDAVAVLQTLKGRFPHLRAIELSRNFGHHPALWCGLHEARGELVFLADSDLETPPELLGDLHVALAGGADLAIGIQAGRPGPGARRLASAAFWRVFNACAGTVIRPGLVTERLLSRQFVDALLCLPDRTLFLTGMMDWLGFVSVTVPVQRGTRPGRPSYSTLRRVLLSVDAVTSFSVVPLRLMVLSGAVLTGLAVAAALMLSIVKLADPTAIVSGFTALAVLLLGMWGTLLAALGVLGLYVGNIFTQTKNRPLYVVRREF